MTVKPVANELFAQFMDQVSGSKFENFAKLVMAAEFGDTFVPLGGMHDGGADGLLSGSLYEGKKANTFHQFAAIGGERAKAKITRTIEALLKAGRTPTSLIYVTSDELPKQDVLQQEVFDEAGVLVTIRDRERLKSILNKNLEANRAFYSMFAGEITSLSQARSDITGAVNEFVEDPTVFVFLNHELRDRSSKDKMLNRVADALIYWSLRETDPDSDPKKLMSYTEISAKIVDVFPTATAQLLPRLSERLTDLRKKTDSGQERLRHYALKAGDRYCLPFDMRKELAGEATKLLREQDAFRESIRLRVAENAEELLKDPEVVQTVELIFHTVHRHFVEQGLLLAAFLEKKIESLFRDQVVEDEMIKVIGIKRMKGVSPQQMAVALQGLRGVFYSPTADENSYLTYLCRTSLLCTTLNVSPRLLEYFNQMGGDFRLFVGTDLLVKAISESFLDPSQQQVTNILKVMAKLGAKLILAEPILVELFTHLHGVDLEFKNHHQAVEQYIKDSAISECDRILIRTYYYARKTKNGPRSWVEFINKLVDPVDLRKMTDKGKEQLQGLLVQRFSLKFLASETLHEGVNTAAVQELSTRLHAGRAVKHEELSYNDALMAHAVYAQRRKHDESGIYDGFGVKTWWLTKETHVLALSGDLLKKHGTPYIMRPEFLLNFITLAPKAAEVRERYADLLPTTVGLQLGQNLDPSVMHSLLHDAAEWSRQQPDRVGVMLSDKATKLKFDRFKQYVHNIP